MAKTLGSAFEAWIAPMADPITGGSKRWEAKPVKAKPAKRGDARLKNRMERKKQRRKTTAATAEKR